MASIELREVETFLVLAEQLHFGRTAERLYVTPSRVSQTIRALETRVGGRLFERTNRCVWLTPVGEKLRDRLAPAYTEMHQAFEAARDLAAGIVGELRISTLSLSALGPSFDLTIGPVLTRQERVLLVKVGHPLLAKGEAAVEDLGDYAVADFEQVLPPETGASFCPPHTPSGRPIKRRYPARTALDVLSAVAEGLIVHPTVTSLPEHYRHPQVTHIPIHGLPTMESALVWVTARETAAIRAFAEVVGEGEVVGGL